MLQQSIQPDRVSFSRRRSTRWLTLSVAAIVAGLALWSAGIPEFRWPWQKEESLVISPPDVAPVAVTPEALAAQAPVLPEIPTGTDSSVSDTPQALILSGTMPGRNAREGVAFIGVSKGSPQTYAAGALLANGAQLSEIYRDHVVLKKGSISADLYLQDAQPKNANTSQLSALLQVGGTPPETVALVPSSDLVTDYLRPSPVYDGELIKGYQVYPGKRSGVFSQMGLKGGDVIVALNDAPFGGTEQAIELFRQLASGIAMVATVERQGKIERVSLDGSVILADVEQQKNAAAMAAQSPGPGIPPI